ncbi:MAG: hypothetical protein CMP05_12940 [Xanthomarina sp.]|uniref:hypothetical protein n=1 Tax=Xanthomarina sp. TaxID=1931211 RepID=UPI000C5930EC|nr:hypothetical protein [Xanthomarina sp.]MAL21710.1 hypothetical protein [Xanthomarina sp.]MBF62887.1 hypothetical protein [Xanthomarina sp.]HAB28013.1 hypothetical protein [Xanthomarina gelatinilytica]HAI19514.1 hypothetical protein [Xanthomarina gelatinilytica]|tara:strand:+ start:29 stop:376 length:348 start_codon:yes stop_codon:yes gene_type:complete
MKDFYKNTTIILLVFVSGFGYAQNPNNSDSEIKTMSITDKVSKSNVANKEINDLIDFNSKEESKLEQSTTPMLQPYSVGSSKTNKEEQKNHSINKNKKTELKEIGVYVSNNNEKK